MSDDDDSQKTEDPSAKKLEDAYNKGQAPKSQEVKTWFMLLGGLVIVAMFSQTIASSMKENLGGIFANAHSLDLSDNGSLLFLNTLITNVTNVMTVPIVVLLVCAFAGSIVQGHIVITAEKMKPKFSKLSPVAGLKKMFSMNSVTELLKSIAKLVIVGGMFLVILYPERGRIGQVVSSSPDALLALILSLTIKLGIAVVAFMAVVAAADFSFQHFQFMKRMRMSIKEVRDETKQQEGDPLVKSKIAQVRAQRSKQRIAQAVPEADVIITNPTHYAVALKYEHGSMEVPVLVAKGVDVLAAKIREIAGEHDIPILENPPLARSIYATVEIDQEIQPDHYKAVAKVISYLLALRKKAGPVKYVP